MPSEQFHHYAVPVEIHRNGHWIPTMLVKSLEMWIPNYPISQLGSPSQTDYTHNPFLTFMYAYSFIAESLERYIHEVFLRWRW